MDFDPPLESGTLIRRYKRFLADVTDQHGRELTIHCPNTGAMTGCAEPGTRIWYSRSDNPKRKYPNTWEIGSNPAGELMFVHSARANAIVREAINEAVVEPFDGIEGLDAEVTIDVLGASPGRRSRFDFAFRRGGRDVVMEVKSVTLRVPDGGAFPDAVSVRARRHVEELAELVSAGFSAILCFAVLHTGIDRVRPAAEIDPDYAAALARAIDAGVEVLPLAFDVSPTGVHFNRMIPFELVTP